MRKILMLIGILYITLLTQNCLSIERENLFNLTYKTSFSKEEVKLTDGRGVVKTEKGEVLNIALEDLNLVYSDEKELKAVVALLSAKREDEKPSYDLIVLIPGKEGLVQLKPYNIGQVRIKKLQGHWEISSMPLNQRWVVDIELELPNGEKELLSLSQRGNEIVPAEETVVRKPALYLYPTKKEKVKVELRVDGKIVKSDPPYNDHWIVEADPDGRLSTGHRYLFYEANLSSPLKLSSGGWVVKKEELPSWMDKTLPKLGLRGREIEDFKSYWLKELPEAPYYIIRKIDERSLSEKLTLKIDPPPNRIIRVFLYIEPADNPINIEPERLTNEPQRIGFTAVEWGVVIKGEAEIKERPKISSNQYETGLILLKGTKIEGPYLTIRVDSGGCTDKKTIEARVRKEKGIVKGYNHYSIAFIRKVPDKCKAFFPDGIDITYNLVEELKLKPPFTISIENPMAPVIPEKYFNLKPKSSSINEITPEISLKIDLIQATIRAIEAEIRRFTSRVPPEPEKARALEADLERFKKMKPEDYPLNGAKPDPFKEPGVIMPPVVEEVEIASLPELGKLLYLTKQSKSGPFFHVAGIAKDAMIELKPDAKPPFKAKIYLVFRREYFAMIKDYYVYVERVLNP